VYRYTEELAAVHAAYDALARDAWRHDEVGRCKLNSVDP
jgi:hypothetical protein